MKFNTYSWLSSTSTTAAVNLLFRLLLVILKSVNHLRLFDLITDCDWSVFCQPNRTVCVFGFKRLTNRFSVLDNIDKLVPIFYSNFRFWLSRHWKSLDSSLPFINARLDRPNMTFKARKPRDIGWQSSLFPCDLFRPSAKHHKSMGIDAL